MGQSDLSTFASDVYDPTDEFTGGDVVDRETVFDAIEEKYRFVSQNASQEGPAQDRALAKMDVYGDALDAIKNGTDLSRLRSEMVQEKKRAESAMAAAEDDVEDAQARGARDAAEDVVDAIGGST